MFSEVIKDLPPLQEDREDVPYNVELLFAYIQINETTDHVLDRVHNKGKQKPFWSKFNFKCWLI